LVIHGHFLGFLPLVVLITSPVLTLVGLWFAAQRLLFPLLPWSLGLLLLLVPVIAQLLLVLPLSCLAKDGLGALKLPLKVVLWNMRLKSCPILAEARMARKCKQRIMATQKNWKVELWLWLAVCVLVDIHGNRCNVFMLVSSQVGGSLSTPASRHPSSVPFVPGHSAKVGACSAQPWPQVCVHDAAARDGWVAGGADPNSIARAVRPCKRR